MAVRWEYDWSLSWEEILRPEYIREWETLFAHSDSRSSPFFHHSVVKAWLESKGGYDAFEPFFLMATSSDGMRGFLPLVQEAISRSRVRVRSLTPVGYDLFDYHDVLFSPGGLADNPARMVSFWDGLSRELKRHEGDWFDQFRLSRTRANCTVGDFERREVVTAPFVELKKYDGFESYLASRSSSLRSDLLRKERRLRKVGELSLEVYLPETVNSFIDMIPRLEKSRLKKYPRSKLPAGYLKRLAEFGCGGGPVHCSSLLLDGVGISWHVGLNHAGTMYWYIMAYDDRFGKYSPGKLHLFYLFQRAFEQRGKAFDFLRGREKYKFEWSDGDEFALYQVSLKSAAVSSRLRVGFAQMCGLNQRLWNGVRRGIRL